MAELITLLIRRRGNIKNNWMTIFPLLLHYFRLLSRSESCNFKFGRFSLITLNVDCGPQTVLSAMTDVVLFSKYLHSRLSCMIFFWFFRYADFIFMNTKRGVSLCRKSLLKSWLKSAWNKHGYFNVTGSVEHPFKATLLRRVGLCRWTVVKSLCVGWQSGVTVQQLVATSRHCSMLVSANLVVDLLSWSK